MIANLPSLAALRAFEATARHMSISLAAKELFVTPGAVSLQVKELETALGIRLFVRRPRSLHLTSEGERYFAGLRPAFRIMREATVELLAANRRPALTVTCTPGFAIQWLMPRLARFEAENPGIDVRISASNRVMDFAVDGIDIAIRHGLGHYEGLISERLLDDDYVPVCGPELAARLGARPEPRCLTELPLLHDEHRNDWRLWMEAAGIDGVDTGRGTIFIDGNGAIEAAKAGLGVALARLSMVEGEITEGRLVAPFPQGVAGDFAYFLVYPASAMQRSEAARFRAFVQREASAGKA